MEVLKLEKINNSRFISIGGVLTTIAVIFQSAPVFLPAFGMVLSPLSTLPIALAAIISIPLGISVLFSTVFILILISVEEATILLLTTGLLGFVVGTLLYRKGIILSILFSSIALSLGIIFLSYILSILAFIEINSLKSTLLTFIIIFIFSIVYASIWNICIKKFINYLSHKDIVKIIQ